jgi:hypothetical protein
MTITMPRRARRISRIAWSLRALTDTWLRIYNSEWPHDSLPRAAAYLLAKAFIDRPVSLCTVYLTGKLRTG